MKKISLIERAIEIAMEAHRGQKDGAGNPYILHPLRMMFAVPTESEKLVAILHDVVEDSDWTLKDLAKEGFPKKILDAVDSLTRRDDKETYDEFVGRARKNPIAVRVKMADLADNMDVRRTGKVAAKDLKRFQKYYRAWQKIANDLSTST